MTASPGRVTFVVLTQYPETDLSHRVASLRALHLADIEIVVVHDMPELDIEVAHADVVHGTAEGLLAQRELGRATATGTTVLVLEPGRELHPEVAAALVDLYGVRTSCGC